MKTFQIYEETYQAGPGGQHQPPTDHTAICADDGERILLQEQDPLTAGTVFREFVAEVEATNHNEAAFRFVREQVSNSEAETLRHCPNCNSEDIEVSTPPSASGTDFWDHAECQNCGYPNF